LTTCVVAVPRRPTSPRDLYGIEDHVVEGIGVDARRGAVVHAVPAAGPVAVGVLVCVGVLVLGRVLSKSA
jgi:hypothetical protein